jgi:uncharacterized protein YjbI with pentapeptide repeats
MDENHQDKTQSKSIVAEDIRWILNKRSKLWVPQHIKQGKANTERIGFSGKSVWDWLNLLGVLAIPFVVTVMGLYFTQQITQQQARLSDAANKQQHQTDLQLSQQQHQTDLQIANDQQQEATLQAYLDKMSDLLLHENLGESKPNDAVRSVARARTLTVLSRLDSIRKQVMLQFLHESNLINVNNPIVSLRYADLSNVDLRYDDLRYADLSGVLLSLANLSFADLSGANLSGTDLISANLSKTNLSKANLSDYINLHDANLSGANLTGAYLLKADLEKANLSGAVLNGAHVHETVLNDADLRGADLRGADLRGTFLERADLTGADLTGADLTGADLYQAIVTLDQLDKAKSLKDAIMPSILP